MGHLKHSGAKISCHSATQKEPDCMNAAEELD